MNGMKKTKEAMEFLMTVRGQYIVGQALYLAEKTLTDKRKALHLREPSNAADMRFLRENVPGWDIFGSLKEMEKRPEVRRFLRKSAPRAKKGGA